MGRILIFTSLCLLFVSCKTKKVNYSNDAPWVCSRDYGYYQQPTKPYISVKSIVHYCDSFVFGSQKVCIQFLKEKKFQVSILDKTDGSKGQYLSFNKAYTDSSYTQYYANGKVNFFGIPLSDRDGFRFGPNNTKHGSFTFYDSFGRIVKIEKYVNNYMEGNYLEYDTNGKIKIEGAFWHDQKQGKWTYYGFKGKRTKEENYTKGNLHGDYREFHANGKIKVSGHYAYGEKVNTWKYFNANGKLIKSRRHKSIENYSFEAFPSPNDYILIDQDAEIMGYGINKSAIDSIVAEHLFWGMSYISSKMGMNVIDYENNIKKAFLKINTGGGCSLVFLQNDSSLVVALEQFDRYVPTQPTVLNSTKGTSYFEINYSLYTKY